MNSHWFCTKLATIVSISVMLFWATISVAQTSPQFNDYETRVYSGTIHPPKWIRLVGNNEWRDDLGKLVEAPEVNFAGKYFVSAHSCGTSCRRYTMSDLSSGRELGILKAFDAAEPAPKTREGHPYVVAC